ncbi:MAG: NHL repeat-containing protein [Candidatus Bipolaricaulia bacterium]
MRAFAWLGLTGLVLLLIAAPLPLSAQDDAPTPPAFEKPELLDVWGSVGDKAGHFQSPWGIDIGPSGQIFISDHKNQRVQVFTNEGEFVRLFGQPGWLQPGQLRGPVGLSVGPAGNVYVADSWNNRIQVFTREGEFLRAWTGPNAGSSSEGPRMTPWGIAVGPDGHVFVSDLKAHLIYKFTSKGELVTTWGGRGTAKGRFTHPTGMEVSPDNRLYVVDSLNHRVQVFDLDGNFQFAWGDQCSLYLHPDRGCEDPDGEGPLGKTDGQFDSPWGVTFGPQGRVYVADSANKRIQVFTPEGEFLGKWGEFGREPGQFDNSVDVVVNDAGQIYVVDLNNQRIQMFSAIGPVADDDASSGN